MKTTFLGSTGSWKLFPQCQTKPLFRLLGIVCFRSWNKHPDR